MGEMMLNRDNPGVCALAPDSLDQIIDMAHVDLVAIPAPKDHLVHDGSGAEHRLLVPFDHRFRRPFFAIRFRPAFVLPAFAILAAEDLVIPLRRSAS
jgi:hypothetical protein